MRSEPPTPPTPTPTPEGQQMCSSCSFFLSFRPSRQVENLPVLAILCNEQRRKKKVLLPFANDGARKVFLSRLKRERKDWDFGRVKKAANNPEGLEKDRGKKEGEGGLQSKETRFSPTSPFSRAFCLLLLFLRGSFPLSASSVVLLPPPLSSFLFYPRAQAPPPQIKQMPVCRKEKKEEKEREDRENGSTARS